MLQIILRIAGVIGGHLQKNGPDGLVDEPDQSELLQPRHARFLGLKAAVGKNDKGGVVPRACLAAVQVGGAIDVHQSLRIVLQRGIQDLREKCASGQPRSHADGVGAHFLERLEGGRIILPVPIIQHEYSSLVIRLMRSGIDTLSV